MATPMPHAVDGHCAMFARHADFSALVNAANAPRIAGYECPVCGTTLELCRGEIRRAYFRHASRGECAWAGESETHQRIKAMIRDYYAAKGRPADLEVTTAGGRADVAVHVGGAERWAFEVQLAALDAETFAARNAAHLAGGMSRVFWLMLGPLWNSTRDGTRIAHILAGLRDRVAVDVRVQKSVPTSFARVAPKPLAKLVRGADLGQRAKRLRHRARTLSEPLAWLDSPIFSLAERKDAARLAMLLGSAARIDAWPNGRLVAAVATGETLGDSLADHLRHYRQYYEAEMQARERHAREHCRDVIAEMLAGGEWGAGVAASAESSRDARVLAARMALLAAEAAVIAHDLTARVCRKMGGECVAALAVLMAAMFRDSPGRSIALAELLPHAAPVLAACGMRLDTWSARYEISRVLLAFIEADWLARTDFAHGGDRIAVRQFAARADDFWHRMAGGSALTIFRQKTQ